MTRPLLSVFLLASLIGCATGAPPSAIERAFYTVTTNWHTQVTPVAQIDSNRVVTATNYVTNVFATFELNEKTNVTTVIQSTGQAATLLGVPGATAISGVVLALLAMWRNYRNKKYGEVMSQAFETAKTVVEQTSGRAASDKLVEHVQSEQVKAGVKPIANKIVSDKVDPVAAKESAAAVLKPTP